jgi:catechol 2,3-dioxygenase-like lactoylglutathione lyase family enzyme
VLSRRIGEVIRRDAQLNRRMQISHMMVPVNDQDEALAFYTDKLGFELRADVPFPGGRWLAVGPASQPDLEVVLIDPDMGPFAPEVVAKVREVVSYGAIGAGILRVDDCHAAYEELRGRGVEFTEEPSERFYGIDAGFRDTSGNPWRLTQQLPPEVVAANLEAERNGAV